MLEITNAQARRVVLNLQDLGEPSGKPSTDAAVRKSIRQMGFVQIDPIRWVERAQHMILFARNEGYESHQLQRMIESKRWLFEAFTHDASIIPCELFQFWKHRFRRDSDRLRKNYAKWQGNGFLEQLDPVVQIIKQGGPVRSRDLRRGAPKTGEMWQWSDSKTALEYLWRTGALSIAARDGIEKVYDMCEKAIPEKHFQAECSEEDFIDWACRSALEKLAFGSASDIAGFWKAVSIAEVRQWIKQNATDVIQVHVQTHDEAQKKMFARADIENVVQQAKKMPNRLRVMSPFDPVNRDRKRLQWMFDFEYRIEIYVPESKRKYGYYVFPLLDGEQIVGRIDMRADREKNVLAVKQVWWEPNVTVTKAIRGRLRSELQRQAKFVGMSKVVEE